MTHPKAIKLFLIDGDPSGRMTAELSNWTGKAYKIPRIDLAKSKQRVDLKSAGVYLLFGKNEEAEDIVYIGQALNIYVRLTQQLTERQFHWTEAIAFMRKGDPLGEGNISYLESQLIKKTEQINRIKLDNKERPERTPSSESEKAEMDEFAEHLETLLGAMGHKILEERDEAGQQTPLYYCKGPRGAKGAGRPVTEGFIVYAGTQASPTVVPSMSATYSTLRKRLKAEKFLEEKDDKLIFPKDYTFSSPSAASSVVLGRDGNGRDDWKLKDGRTLKEVEEADSKS